MSNSATSNQIKGRDELVIQRGAIAVGGSLPSSRTPSPINPVTPPHSTEERRDSVRNRDFLSRPRGQEDDPDPWDAWTPFMLWLLEHHPSQYYAVCNAEDAIT